MTASTNISPPVRGPGQRRGMHPMRRISLAAGILYVPTFVSIPTPAPYKAVKDGAGTFVLGAPDRWPHIDQQRSTRHSSNGSTMNTGS